MHSLISYKMFLEILDTNACTYTKSYKRIKSGSIITKINLFKRTAIQKNPNSKRSITRKKHYIKNIKHFTNISPRLGEQLYYFRTIKFSVKCL